MTFRIRDVSIIIALIAAYFAGMILLALTVDRAFLFNDAVALVLWVIFGLLFVGSGLFVSRR